MIVSCQNSRGLGLNVKLVEPDVNREASSYVIDNYNELVNIIIKTTEIKEEKAKDLLHDVFISLVEAENNGNGFNMEYGNKHKEDGQLGLMSVPQFVIGRIKLYAKNLKYRTDIVEAGSTFLRETLVYYDTELDKNGQVVIDKKTGKPKLIKRTERKKVNIMATSNAASFNDGGDVDENNDEFQKAFAMSSVADSTDDIAEILSLREQIDYCIDICDLHNVNILNIFRNIDTLANMIDYSKRKKSSESVFDKLTELTEYHSELGSTLMDIFKFSAKNRAAFEVVLATY